MRHDTVIIRGDVHIGERVVLEPYCVIDGPCVIEDDAYIGAHAMIGAPPQHHGSYPTPVSGQRRVGGVRVGRGACVREYATLHQGVVRETVVGAGAVVMAYTHISHDSIVGEEATLSTNTILGGFTLIDARVTFGQGVITHPWVTIGEAAMVGLNSSVLRDVLPFSKVAGVPARLLGTNTHKAPGAPADYEPTVFGADVWERWSGLQDQQRAAREAWAGVAA
jgi:UDP-N-acetylglucosamine acyltransferase